MPMACATASNASSTKSSITAGSQRATKRRHAIFSRWSCSPPLWSGCETWSKCQQDLVRDQQGIFWFDVNPGRRSLGRLDPKTEKIDVYMTPPNMSPLGGAVTLDVDGKGKVWASAPDGAVCFDPATEAFTAFKSLAYKTARGTGMTYGAAGDRDGNGWWSQMAFDTIGKADTTTGQTLEVKLPEVKA